MAEIDEFKARLRGEAEAATESIQEMQTQAAEQFREMRSNYADLPRREPADREALRPWVEAFAESLPGVTPVVTERDSGPAGRVFHGVFFTFSLPGASAAGEHHAPVRARAGVAINGLTLSYDVEIVPLFIQFERHDQIALPPDSSSVAEAVAWFQQKALTFTRTYVSLFFRPEYQKGQRSWMSSSAGPFPALREGPDQSAA